MLGWKAVPRTEGGPGGCGTQGSLPGPRSCGRNLTLLVLAQESVLINNLL